MGLLRMPPKKAGIGGGDGGGGGGGGGVDGVDGVGKDWWVVRRAASAATTARARSRSHCSSVRALCASPPHTGSRAAASGWWRRCSVQMARQLLVRGMQKKKKNFLGPFLPPSVTFSEQRARRAF
jgi:hypothetical protein